MWDQHEQAIADYLKQVSGLETDLVGTSSVRAAIQGRLKARRETTLEYLATLQSFPDELQFLIEETVVSETWFFRESGAFPEYPGLARAQIALGRRFRVLSAPCASGEEAYSVAMCLLQAGIPPESLAVDGLDLSQQALDKAARGLYGRNSFRGGDLEFRDRLFQPVGEGWQLSAEVMACVAFHQGNLLSSHCMAGSAYDLILCRNLLIYISEPARPVVFQTLADLLAEGGRLQVAACESALVPRDLFQTEGRPGNSMFKRIASTLELPSSTNDQPPARRRRGTDRPVRPRRQRPRPKKENGLGPAVTSSATVSEERLSRAQQMADRGKLESAAQICREELEESGPTAEFFFLLGLIELALGQDEGCERSFRRAIYLAPRHGPALRHLALVLRRSGRLEEAGRFDRRADQAEVDEESWS